jgi:uncharacterized protein (DUF4415 family)
MKKPDPERTDRDNPEWTDADFKRAKPARTTFPDLAEYSEKRKRGQRGPQKAPVKEAVSLRIDKDVLAKYKATGRGWQSRVNVALRRGTKGLYSLNP